jgi:hypothetical protein
MPFVFGLERQQRPVDGRKLVLALTAEELGVTGGIERHVPA